MGESIAVSSSSFFPFADVAWLAIMWGQILGSTSQSSWGRDFFIFMYAEWRDTRRAEEEKFRRWWWCVTEHSGELECEKWGKLVPNSYTRNESARGQEKIYFILGFPFFWNIEWGNISSRNNDGGVKNLQHIISLLPFFASHSRMGEDVLCVRKNIRVEESLVIGALWRKNAGEIVWENALPIPDV